MEVIKGACLLLRREALDQVGLLDDRYFMYTEEVDLCYRLAQAGWQLWYVPQRWSPISAKPARQVQEAMYLQLYRSKIQFYRKFGGEQQAQRFKRLLRLAYGSRIAATTVAGPFSPHLTEQGRTFRSLLTQLPRM